MAPVLVASIFVLVSTGVYLLLHRKTLRILLGLGLITHAVHLLVLCAGRLGSQAPLTSLGSDPLPMSDPLPQALVLTSIVISMAITLYILGVMTAATGSGMGNQLEQAPVADPEVSGEKVLAELEGRSDWRETP